MNNLKKTRVLCFIILIAVSSFVHFAKYSNLSLLFSGPFHMDLITYEDKARFTEWEKLIEESKDPFVTETYKDKERLTVGVGLYNFCNLPFHFFYKIGLHGEALWLAAKSWLAFLGVMAAVAVFLLANLFYGPVAGLIAGVLTAFSPHIWITYHLDANIDRAYNFILSVLSIYLFALFLRNKKIFFFVLGGFAMGANYLFFNIGSPMTPLILLIYCIILSIKARSIKPLKYVVIYATLSVLAAVILSLLHQTYLRLSFNPLLTWISTYLHWGPTASHSAKGMMFLQPKELFANIKNHLFGVFVTGKTADWHYMASPPGVPMVYNYFISLLFFLGIFYAFLKKSTRDILFLVWFLTYFIVYCLIFMRPKNIIWELVPIFILAARAMPVAARWISEKIEWFPRKLSRNLLALFLCLSTIASGSYFIFAYLPKRNFYDGAAYAGTYQIFRHMKEKGYGPKTAVVFTSPQVNVGQMMLRSLSDNEPHFVNLSHIGVVFPPQEQALRTAEETILKNNDSAFFCFFYYQNNAGYTYATDDPYLTLFKSMHPDLCPFIVKGTDGSALWHVYFLDKPGTTAPAAPKPQVSVSQAPALQPPEPQIAEACPNPIQANNAFSDRLIGGTFKILAKSFVAVISVTELKKYNIKKLRKMSDDKFKSRYEKTREFLKDLPQDAKNRVGFKENMTRRDAIAATEALDKMKIFEIISVVPDSFIANKFREYMNQNKEKQGEGSVTTQIHSVWKKIIAGAPVQGKNQ